MSSSGSRVRTTDTGAVLALVSRVRGNSVAGSAGTRGAALNKGGARTAQAALRGEDTRAFDDHRFRATPGPQHQAPRAIGRQFFGLQSSHGAHLSMIQQRPTSARQEQVNSTSEPGCTTWRNATRALCAPRSALRKFENYTAQLRPAQRARRSSYATNSMRLSGRFYLRNGPPTS